MNDNNIFIFIFIAVICDMQWLLQDTTSFVLRPGTLDILWL